MKIRRFEQNPIVRPHMDGRMGDNVNGPSLVRVPAWVSRPLGRYYLYFGHHDGRYIRLAYANNLVGPWTTYEPGVLPLAASHFQGHIASPDVLVDDDARQIRLYYHGSDEPTGVASPGQAAPVQFSRVALSSDGLTFEARPENLGRPYLRVFRWQETHYAIGMPGLLYRSADGLAGFELAPAPLLPPSTRHVALKLDGDLLTVFFTRIGDAPEAILRCEVRLGPDWRAWRASEPVLTLAPELTYEGADLPNEPSRRGLVHGPVRQLRDPAIFREDGRDYLLYAVAGESGIAIAELLPA